MTRNTVLIGTAALVLAIAAMSATGSGIRDVVDPDLTAEVEGLVERSVREYAGLDPTPIPPPPVPVDRIPTEVRSSVPTGIPTGAAAHIGVPFVEIPLIVEDGHVPLTDLDALYGVYGYGTRPAAVPAPAHIEPPLVDDTPAMIASTWSNPPLDIK